MKRVSLIPYVCGAGASVPGAEQGSLYARANGLSEKLSACGIDTVWAIDPDNHWNGPYGRIAHENLPERGTDERREIVTWHLHALAENVATELRRGHRAVALGGDHSLAAGSIAGAYSALGPDVRLGLIWIDAHPDLNIYKTSVSKALHGIPVSSLSGLDDTLAIQGCPAIIIRPEDIFYAGLRWIDVEEIDNANQHGFNLMSMAELRSRGVATMLQDAAMTLASRCDHILLSIDIDAFDPEIAPATGSPVPDGFTLDEILPVLAGIIRAYSVPLIDIVEFNPTLPGAEKTHDLIIKLLSDLLPD